MSSKALLGFVAGVSAGAILGILFAPDKGTDTRSKIASKTGDISDSIKDAFCDFIDSVKDKVKGTKEEAEDLVNSAPTY